MKKLILAFALLMVGYVGHAQISMPSTYEYTKKVFGEPRFTEVKSYFIFRSANEVIWCMQSHDNYIFPVAFGSYNASTRQIVFTKKYSYFSAFVGGNIIFSVSFSNGAVRIKPTREDMKDFFEDEGWSVLTKQSYALTPSSKLVGTSWVCQIGEDRSNIYFKSKTEALVDGEPRGYILIGNAIGILTGDSVYKEAVCGNWSADEIRVKRSGLAEIEFQWFEFKKAN